MDQLNKRIDRAAESILENEALSSELDDAAAKVLLQWGVARATTIATETAGLDEQAAEGVMYPRQKALRRLLRYTSVVMNQAQSLRKRMLVGDFFDNKIQIDRI